MSSIVIGGELTRCRNCGRWVQRRNVTMVEGEEYGPKCSRKVATWAAALAAAGRVEPPEVTEGSRDTLED